MLCWIGDGISLGTIFLYPKQTLPRQALCAVCAVLLPFGVWNELGAEDPPTGALRRDRPRLSTAIRISQVAEKLDLCTELGRVRVQVIVLTILTAW